jgi:hypothetical protein
VKTHLPYAFLPENEFHHPRDGWLLLERSVVFDSWISWRHVLPPGRRDCQRLTDEIHEAITALAAALHEIHQRLPDYRGLSQSPFKVSQWWDPDGGHPWDSGGTCVLEIEGYTSDEFIAFLPSGGRKCRLERVSKRAVLAALN